MNDFYNDICLINTGKEENDYENSAQNFLHRY